MKVIASILAVALVSACTPEVMGQFDRICANITAAHTLLANGNVAIKPSVQTAFDSASAICIAPPKDVPSAVLTLAALYLVISKAQEKAI